MMSPVDKYAHLLSGLTCSETRDRAIVKKIRQMGSYEDAIAFFRKAEHPPSISRFIFYPIDAQRETIRDLQNYLREIGMQVPAPDKPVQRFLDGGRYPKRKIPQE